MRRDEFPAGLLPIPRDPLRPPVLILCAPVCSGVLRQWPGRPLWPLPSGLARIRLRPSPRPPRAPSGPARPRGPRGTAVPYAPPPTLGRGAPALAVHARSRFVPGRAPGRAVSWAAATSPGVSTTGGPRQRPLALLEVPAGLFGGTTTTSWSVRIVRMSLTRCLARVRPEGIPPERRHPAPAPGQGDVTLREVLEPQPFPVAGPDRGVRRRRGGGPGLVLGGRCPRSPSAARPVRRGRAEGVATVTSSAAPSGRRVPLRNDGTPLHGVPMGTLEGEAPSPSNITPAFPG